MNIQHDCYKAIVEEIISKSAKLQAFAMSEKTINSNAVNHSHLQRRGEIRRLSYEHSIFDSDRTITGNDMLYESRDQQASLPKLPMFTKL